MKKPNAIVIVIFRSRLANNYLEKVFFIIEKYYKQLNILPNDVKLRIHVIDQLEIDLFVAKNTAISSVVNTIKKLHIQYNLHFIFQKYFYGV